MAQLSYNSAEYIFNRIPSTLVELLSAFSITVIRVIINVSLLKLFSSYQTVYMKYTII